MQKLIPLQLMIFLIQIICLLGLARQCGEVVKKFGMPIVLGELLAGVLLGPTIFAAVGLKVNFFNSFDLSMVLIILVAAYAGKMLAAWMGGFFSHLSRRESTIFGLGISARGGMGIILATIALEAKFIPPNIFTALVLMAIITSIFAGFIKFFMASVS
jgi:Kef-type K+ transport system membrane component KefB